MILNLISLAFAIPSFTIPPVNWSIREPTFPIAEIRWLRHRDERSPAIQFTVPDEDTTLPTDGGSLRRYDVHVAKMFEITHSLCQRREEIQWIDWFYEAAGGRVSMGKFKIKCWQAREVADTYGLDSFEKITIDREFEGGEINTVSTQYLILGLKLTGNKVSKWMDFVQQFHPDFTVALVHANSQIPIQQMLQAVEGETQVPLLLPDSYSSSGEAYFTVQFNENGYSAAFSPCQGLVGGACYYASIYADKNEKLTMPDPNDRLQRIEPIQLAHGIQGFGVEYGSATMRFVEWEYEGIIYKAHGKRQIPDLVEIANSAIEAGSR